MTDFSPNLGHKGTGSSDRAYYIFALKIASDFGATIAVPVVIFVLIGQYLDAKYNAAPWYLAIGFVLAAVLSGRSIYKKAKKYGQEYQKMTLEK